jgi:uncharacterized membrane protein
MTGEHHHGHHGNHHPESKDKPYPIIEDYGMWIIAIIIIFIIILILIALAKKK